METLTNKGKNCSLSNNELYCEHLPEVSTRNKLLLYSKIQEIWQIYFAKLDFLQYIFLIAQEITFSSIHITCDVFDP